MTLASRDNWLVDASSEWSDNYDVEGIIDNQIGVSGQTFVSYISGDDISQWAQVLLQVPFSGKACDSFLSCVRLTLPQYWQI